MGNLTREMHRIPPQMPLTQGRASAVSSLETSSQGTMRTLLIVADTRKSATAEDGNSKNGQV